MPYLQQDAFNEVDSATPVKRQREVFNTLGTISPTSPSTTRMPHAAP